MKNKINNQSGIVFIHLVISILILAILITVFVVMVKGGKIRAHNAKIDSIISQNEIAAVTGTSAYTFTDGSKYVGEFKDGRFHGQGTLTYAEGDVVKGKWEDGILTEMEYSFFKDFFFNKGESSTVVHILKVVGTIIIVFIIWAVIVLD